MTADLEHRLRLRIDVLIDERDYLRRVIAAQRPRIYETVTRDKVLGEVRELAALHGRPPRCRDDWRIARRAKIAFGSWAAAVEAAGFERPRPRVASTGPRVAA